MKKTLLIAFFFLFCGSAQSETIPLKTDVTSEARIVVDTETEDIKKAEDLFHKKDFDSAILILNKLAERGSNNYLVYWWRGRCLDSKNNNDAALKDYLKALEIDPQKSSKLYKAIANIYVAQGNYDEAIVHYNKYLMYFPEDGEAYYGIGYADFKKGYYDNSILYIRKAASFNVHDSQNIVAQIGQIQMPGKKKLLAEVERKKIDFGPILMWSVIISLVLLYVYFLLKEIKRDAPPPPDNSTPSEKTFKGYDKI